MTTALLDTSVIIDWADPAVIDALPDHAAVSAVSFAELSAGPALAKDASERARRTYRLQQVESLFDAIPFDALCARSFGVVIAAVASPGRSHRGRFADLMIAATAHANAMPLLTRNPGDFVGLDEIVEVLAV